MRATVVGKFLLGLTITASSFTAVADDVDEIRSKSLALMREAAELSENGHREEAEKLKLRARELVEKAEQAESRRRDGDVQHKAEMARRNPDIQHLKERLVDLMAAQQKAKESGSEQEAKEISEQIAQAEKKLVHLASQHGEHRNVPEQFRPQVEKLAVAARRVQHVRIAAENLMAAEMPDMAHELTKRAEAMEQEIHTAKTNLAQMIEAGAHERGGEPKGEVGELQSENKRLRRELNELREVVEQLQLKLKGEPKTDEF